MYKGRGNGPDTKSGGFLDRHGRFAATVRNKRVRAHCPRRTTTNNGLGQVNNNNYNNSDGPDTVSGYGDFFFFSNIIYTSETIEITDFVTRSPRRSRRSGVVFAAETASSVGTVHSPTRALIVRQRIHLLPASRAVLQEGNAWNTNKTASLVAQSLGN